MKFEINGHNGHKGKTVICQATVMKVLGIKDLNINERFSWIFDIRHNQYGRIGVKQSMLKGVGYTEAYRFVTENHKKKNKKYNNRIDYDTYFFLGFDSEWKNIEKTYIVPNKGKIRDIENITIGKNSLYDEFKVDNVPYNPALQSLMRFIEKDGNVVLVDTEDVDKWLKV